MKVIIANNFEEWYKLEEENRAYKQRNRRYKYEIKVPNYLGFFYLEKIANGECPRCKSSEVFRVSRCVPCGTSNHKCRGCGAFWQQALPKLKGL